MGALNTVVKKVTFFPDDFLFLYYTDVSGQAQAAAGREGHAPLNLVALTGIGFFSFNVTLIL